MTIWGFIAMWFRFFWPFRAGVPAVGSNLLPYIDCIFVQAFGRGTWSDEELFQELMKVRSRANMNVYDTFMILRDEVRFQPGLSNVALAQYVIWISRLYPNAAYMIQWEVAYAIFEEDPDWFVDNMDMIDCIFPAREDYFATYHVKEISRQLMIKRGGKLPLEIAHPAMIARATMTIWKTGVYAVVMPDEAWNIQGDPLWVWDSQSQQPWTRSFRAWLPREFLGRMISVFMHMFPFVPYLLPGTLRKKLPGNWIRFTPPPLPRLD